MKDLHPDALRVLELAHAERNPSEADKARIEAKLALSVGAAALASAAAASSASSAAAQGALSGLAAQPAAAAFKLWLAGGAILSVVAASYVLTRSDEAPIERAARAVHAPAPVSAPPEDVVAPAPALVVEHEVPSVPARTHKAKREPTRDKAGLVAEELELLHAAQAAWRARAAREALALVKAHRARFPRSQLALERDAIQVLSLCELGQTDEASALGRRWLERAPSSPLRSSIESSCIVR